MRRKALFAILACIIAAIVGLFVYGAVMLSSCTGTTSSYSSGNASSLSAYTIVDDPPS